MSTLWLCLCVLIQISWTLPIYLMKNDGLSVEHNIPVGRTKQTNNSIKKQRTNSNNGERMEILEVLGADKWSKGENTIRYHHSQCNYMNQPWTQWQHSTDSQDPSSVYMLRIITGPLKPTFPQNNLFQYMSMVYRCCKHRFSCGKLKGLQGTLNKGRREAAFYIDPDIVNLNIQRAELRLKVSADNQLTVIPVLNNDGLRSSSFTQRRSGHVVDLAVNVMTILQVLREKGLADAASEEVTELSLSFHCVHNHLPMPCNHRRVFVLQPPFIALQYK